MAQITYTVDFNLTPSTAKESDSFSSRLEAELTLHKLSVKLSFRVRLRVPLGRWRHAGHKVDLVLDLTAGTADFEMVYEGCNIHFILMLEQR